MALDLFALALLIIGIARSPDFDCPDWKTDFERAASPMGRKHAVGHSPELSRSNTGGDDEGITRRHDVQSVDFSALEISRARMSADAGETAGPPTPRVAEFSNARGGIDIRNAHNATPYKWVWTRVLDSGYQQGLHCVIVIAMMKIGMLVCVILNSSPENAAEAMDFQSMCMCIPALVTMSIATNRLFLQITQASRSGDGFMIRQPETMEQLENAGGAGADTFEPERMALPEYVNRAVFVQRIRREEDALDAGAVIRTFGGTMRENPERTQRKNSKATQRLDIPRYKTKEETSERTNQRGEGSGGY
ncbi:hypothetical protein DFH11DRAFT_784976 [Phellopilus nigrolimitatus]|nr:hypothetical protein DFH11DRAFT_784976 [Phellopilus nigrolimitatus]